MGMQRALLFVSLLPALLPGQAAPFHYFDPERLVDIQGSVRRIDLEETYAQGAKFLILTIERKDQGPCRVEICPAWFLENDIAIGMKVRFRASPLAAAQEIPYLIAQEISIQGERIALRDRHGFPLWSQRGLREGGRKGAGRHGRR